MPKFTYDNFTKFIPVWEDCILNDEDIKASQKRPDLIYALDIGAGEGMASLWMQKHVTTGTGDRVYCCDTWIQRETEKTFDRNVTGTDESYKIVKVKGNVEYKMYELALLGPVLANSKFDLIYIHGTTVSRDALRQFLTAFTLLKDKGIMIIGNYDAKAKVTALGKQSTHYREMVEVFRRTEAGRYEILFEAEQLIIKKLTASQIQ